MANIFDQFDQPTGNIFDQFDKAPLPSTGAGGGRGSVNPPKGANEFARGDASRGPTAGIIASAQSSKETPISFDSDGAVVFDDTGERVIPDAPYVGNAGRGSAEDPRRTDNVTAGEAFTNSAARTAKKFENLGRAVAAKLGLADDEATTEAFRQMQEDEANAVHPRSTIGKIAEAVPGLLPMVAAAAVNPVLGATVGATQFGAESGMSALDQGKSLENAQLKAAANAVMGTTAMNKVMGPLGEWVSKMPIPTDTLKHAVTGAATGEAFGYGGRAVDYGVDQATGEVDKTDGGANQSLGDYLNTVDPVVAAAPLAGLGAAHHAVPKVAGYVTDKAVGAVSPQYQAAREMSRTMDATNLQQAVITPARLNPNIAAAPTVDAAIAAATTSLPSVNPAAVQETGAKNLAETMAQIRPLDDALQTKISEEQTPPSTFETQDAALEFARQNGVEDQVDVTPTDDGFTLLPKGQKETIGDIKREQLAVSDLADAIARTSGGDADGAAGREPTLSRIETTSLPDGLATDDGRNALTSFSLVARAAQSLFGFKPILVDGLENYGVYHNGNTFIDASEVAGNKDGMKPATLMTWVFGHEGMHWIERSKDPADQAAYAKLNDLMLQYGRESVVNKRRAEEIYPDQNGQVGIDQMARAAKRGQAEMVADASGNMWTDHKFWSRMYDIDNGSTMRRVAYKFMEAATKFMQAAKGKRQDIRALLKDGSPAEIEAMVEQVRNAVADVWAQKAMARKEVVSRTKAKEQVFGEQPQFARAEVEEKKDELGAFNLDRYDVTDKDSFLTDEELQNKLRAELKSELYGVTEAKQPVPAKAESVDFGTVKDADLKQHGLHPENAYPDLQYQDRDYGGKFARFKVNGKDYVANVKEDRTPNITSNETGRTPLHDILPHARGRALPHDMGKMTEAGKMAWNKRFAAQADLMRRRFDLYTAVPKEARERVAHAWNTIGKMGDAFEFNKPENVRGKNMAEVAQNISDQMLEGGRFKAKAGDLSPDERTYHGDGVALEITDSKTGVTSRAVIEYDRHDREVVMHTQDLEKGSGAGKAVYQIGQEFANAFGAKIHADRAGLLGVNNYRRTEQMFSGMLRSGKPETMQPGVGQRIYGWNERAKTPEHHERNMVRTALAIARNVAEFFPQIKDIRYDIETGKFLHNDGSSAEGIVTGVLKSPDARAMSLSRSTLARAAITHEAIAGEVKVPERVAEPVLYARKELGEYMDRRNKTMDLVSPKSVLHGDISLATKAVDAALSEISGGNRDVAPVPIGRIPHALTMLRQGSKMMSIDTSVLRKVFLEKHANEFGNITPDALIRSIYQPAMVLKGKDGDMEIVTSLITKKGPVIVPVAPSTRLHGSVVNAATIKSVYGRKVAIGGDSILQRLRDGALLYADPALAQVAVTGRKSVTPIGVNAREALFSEARPIEVQDSNVNEKADAVKPLNPYYVGWKDARDIILDGIASKKVKSDVDLMKWIGNNFKPESSESGWDDAPAFARKSSEDAEHPYVKKSERMAKFHESYPDMQDRIMHDADSGNEAAVVLRLISQTGFRIGGDPERGSRGLAYGATTLKNTHISVEGDTIKFDFIGKSQVRQQHELVDPELAELLSHRANREKLFNVTDEQVRRYLRSISGDNQFKVHDFRTRAATVAALNEMKSIDAPTTPQEYWKAVDQAGRAAAIKIGDKLTTALEHYVDPEIFADWRKAAGVAEGATRSEARGGQAPRVEEGTRDPERALRQEGAEEVAPQFARNEEVENSPKFKKWFGDSKVVDEGGRPIILYHGTDKSFDSFDPSKSGAKDHGWYGVGHYLTADPETASAYSVYNEMRDGSPTTGANVMPVYVSLENPYVWPKDRKAAQTRAEAERITAELQKQGYDGVVVPNEYQSPEYAKFHEVIAFKPEQVKSATGNNGDFDASNPDIRYARIPGARLIDTATTAISDAIDSALDRSGVYEKVAPMSSGSNRTRAAAQKWINNQRRAEYEWKQLDKLITDNFTEAQRTKMFNAADEQNELLSLGKSTAGKGLDRLTKEERDAMDMLHKYGEELLQRAKAVGMFKGDGVPYWTPRMMAMIDPQSGDFVSGSGKKDSASNGTGKNFTTSSANLKQRKYLTADESEAAMAKLGGMLVRDIRTMPLAMSKLEKAIAGRELVNKVKELGYAVGEDYAQTHEKEGYFTMDHPAFQTFRPRLQEVNGKWEAVKDADGNIIFDKQPIFISKEWEGPLKAILSEQSGQIYRGYMLLKSKSMSAIMYSPLIHNQVIAGRAFAYAGLKLPMFYFTGNRAKADQQFMRKMIGAGMVPIGGQHQMLDVGDVARGIGKEGSWGDPNESWLGLGMQKVGNFVKDGVGDKLKSGVDAFGDFWHNTLLWDRVGDLQAGIAKDVYTKLIAKGMDENAATTIAAHISNRYAGAVGRENMSAAMHKFANVLLFSKSFNAGNVGQVKDVLYGLPAGLKAQLIEGSSGKSAKHGMDFAKRKAFTGMVLDFTAAILLTSMVQDWFKRDGEKSWKDQLVEGLEGYQKRAAEAWANLYENPLEIGSYNPYRLSSTFHNEPGKEERIDMGAQPNSGRHEYMRLPTGKVVEDIYGWTMHPVETLGKKLSPLASAIKGLATNDKTGFGTPIVDPSSPLIEKAMDVAKFLVGKNIPLDQIQTAKDVAAGVGTQLDKDKLAGNFSGLTVSQGNPNGPEGAVAREVEDRVDASKKYAMEGVKRDLKYGDEDSARARLEKAGLAPKEITLIIRNLQNPRDGLSRSQRKKFNQHANEEEQRMMDEVAH